METASLWSTPLANKGLSIWEVTLFGVLAALTFGAKVAMSYLPNIEPVTLFLMIFGAVFGWKSLFIVYVYVLAEILFYGIGTWNVNYLYIWVIPAAAGCLLRQRSNPVLWAVIAGVFGLLFGAFCAPVDLFIGGLGYAVSKWISGIPFDVAHCAGNFVLALLLFQPLRKLTQRLVARPGR
jgi:energy-coupling factor transport system substrate-specific component